MKVLVAGGTGFIGSHLTERLLQEGLQVRVPVRKGCNLGSLSAETVDIVEGDLLDTACVEKLLRDVDVVFHLASIRGSGWAHDDDTVYAVNVGITGNLLRASAKRGGVRFIYVSSVSVYGHPQGGPVAEDFPCAPATRYGRTKYESEGLVREFHSGKEIAATIIRPVITYGPGDSWGMIPKLVSLINANRYLTVGNGENRVHLIYIDDLIDGLMLAYESAGPELKTYILAGQEPISINRLVSIVAAALKRKVFGLHIPMPVARFAAGFLELVFRLFHLHREPFVTHDKIDIMCRDRLFSIQRAREDLGFAPKIGYETGISRAVEWLKAEHIGDNQSQ